MIRKGRLIAALIFSFVLFGCSTFADIQGGLSAMVGKPVSTAIEVLGYPNSRMDIGSDEVYIWKVDQTGVVYVPQTLTTTGQVGSTNFSSLSTYSQAQIHQSVCTVRVISGRNGLIKSWDFSGNISGCESFSGSLDRFSKANPVPEPQILDSGPSAQEKWGVGDSVIGRSSTSLHIEPSHTSDILLWLSYSGGKGKQGVVLEIKGDWARLTVDGITGWSYVPTLVKFL